MNNLIDHTTDKDGVKVEIEIKNLPEPIIVAEKPMNIGIEYRYADTPEIIYGGSTYFQGAHFTEEEMKATMEIAKSNVDSVKF